MKLTQETIEMYRRKASESQHAGLGAINVNCDELLALLDEVAWLRSQTTVGLVTSATCVLIGLIVFTSSCSAWRLRTPEVSGAAQTNSVGEAWTPGK